MAGEKMMREDQQQAVLFAAGIAALMACLERAVIVSLWRVWAFLALNLLLLAIALTSKSPIRPNEVNQDGDHHSVKVARKKMSIQRESHGPSDSISVVKLAKGEEECAVVENDGMEEAEDELSKEELNRRVEAFIAMFRQHLVSDHAKSRSFRVQQ